MTPTVIGRRLRERRESHDPKITAAEFARRVGVKPPTVCGWESGRYKPSLEHLHKCAEVLGCEVGELIAAESSAEAA